jgi:hypothetical protein
MEQMGQIQFSQLLRQQAADLEARKVTALVVVLVVAAGHGLGLLIVPALEHLDKVMLAAREQLQMLVAVAVAALAPLDLRDQEQLEAREEMVHQILLLGRLLFTLGAAAAAPILEL